MRTLLLALLPLGLLACRVEKVDPGEPDVDADGDGLSAEDGDCDDADADVGPDMTEACDGVDNNCDGEVDEGLTTIWHADGDADGFGVDDAGTVACEPPDATSVADHTDCDDTRADVYPAAPELCDNADNDCDAAVDEDDRTTWYADTDGDGYGDPAVMEVTCNDLRPGYVTDDTDCDDTTAAVFPGNPEICDGLDNDCDLEIDEGVTTTWYEDGDGDGYGLDTAPAQACEQPDGYAPGGGDCDDAAAAFNPGASEACTENIDYNCDGSVAYADADADGWAACEECDDAAAGVHPAATEVCNGFDDDCDGGVDDDDDTLDTSTGTVSYADGDTDGYGAAASAVQACVMPAGHVVDATDCDDGAAAVNPAASEVCNGIDDDCDGGIDDDDASLDASTTTAGYADADGDGYGDAAGALSRCDLPADHVSDATDCDDTSGAVNPGAGEVCNEIDDDCDGAIDDDDDSVADGTRATWYRDADGDGYGDTASSALGCDAPANHVSVDGDCDDTSGDYHPGAAEDCTDEEDYDCDGSVTFVDADMDGWAACEDCDDVDPDVSPGAVESCNGLDDDCDGAVDAGDGIWSDDFEDDDISDWSVLDGAWSASAGVVSGYSDSHTGPDLIRATGMDGTEDGYTVHMRGAGAYSFGIVLGYGSSTSHCGFHFWAGSTLYLVNSSTTETNVGSFSFANGTYYDVVAEVTPGNVDLYFGGTRIYSGDAGCDAFTRDGSVGLQVHQSATAYFDSVCVEY